MLFNPRGEPWNMANLLWHAMGSFTAALPADIRCNQNETTMNETCCNATLPILEPKWQQHVYGD